MNMYSSRGSSGYGQQQPYSSQSSYTPQNLGAASLLGGGHKEAELGGYRTHGHVHGHPSGAAETVSVPPPQHYGGLYNSVYGSGAQQFLVSRVFKCEAIMVNFMLFLDFPMGTKGSATTVLEGRSNYGSSMPESPKFTAGDYVSSSSRGYGQKVDQLFPDRASEYPSVDRRQYAERHSAYLGRIYRSKLYDRLEQPTVLRQEEMLKGRTLQSSSVDGGARQADYLAARTAVHHPLQDPIAYGGRIDPESRAAPQRSVDDLIYAQSSTNPGYGVSLPPGRDYGAGKGLRGSSRELDYQTGMLDVLII
ncbi:UNVERIFIED_CONTAM: protein SHORT ROOT IN SALT MEDIUM 1 [Sesamum calycinum]|uniref:Protein SHORT ROOT IN SALT MEDIUM 1 n=1 Tax=Sesamum calycinum TaxID=2727403 RepID=A0AAW2QZB6_9LAMI